MQKNPVVVITGASSGIGAALARRLAHDGARLVLGARRVERLHALADELPGTVALPCDITVRTDAERLIATAIDRFGRLDVLVNNAGRGHFASVEETTDEVIESMFRVNVYSLWYTTRPALRQMKMQGTGHIINVASLAGKIGFGFNSAYVAAKHATVGFTMALRQELAETGIHASVVCPFGVLTDWASATEGGAMLPMFSASGPLIKQIAQERDLPLPPIEGVIPAERVADAIVDCMKHPVAEVYTHRGSHEFVVLANQNREEAERQQLAVNLGERQIYQKIKSEKIQDSQDAKTAK